MSITDRIARSFLARAIPLDKPAIHQLALELEKFVALKGSDEPLGDRVLTTNGGITIRDVKGNPIYVRVALQAKKSTSPYRVPSGALGKLHGEPIVLVYLNGSLRGSQTTAEKNFLYKDIEGILFHELTHAIDVYSKGIGKTHTMSEADDDPKAYYNNPSEVRAFTRDIIEESKVFRAKWEKLVHLFNGPGKALDVILKNSDTWLEIEPHLTEKSKRVVIKNISQAIEEEASDY